MRKIRNNKGITLTEVMISVGLFGFIAACTMGMLITATKTADGASTKAFTDADAVIAMNRIVDDVREAKSVSIPTNGAYLTIVFPVKNTSTGYYDRHIADAAHQICYYLSDKTGTQGKIGTWLWRSKDSTTQIIKRNVTGLYFEQDTARSVKITVTAKGSSADGDKETELTQRVVYLRNY